MRKESKAKIAILAMITVLAVMFGKYGQEFNRQGLTPFPVEQIEEDNMGEYLGSVLDSSLGNQLKKGLIIYQVPHMDSFFESAKRNYSLKECLDFLKTRMD